jgi:hypothetical protein
MEANFAEIQEGYPVKRDGELNEKTKNNYKEI